MKYWTRHLDSWQIHAEEMKAFEQEVKYAVCGPGGAIIAVFRDAKDAMDYAEAMERRSATDRPAT